MSAKKAAVINPEIISGAASDDYQVIGSFYLNDQAGFNTQCNFFYWDGNSWEGPFGPSGSFPLGQGGGCDPGQYNVDNGQPTQSGSIVAIAAIVEPGGYIGGKQFFTYQSGSPVVATYVIAGAIWNPQLGLQSVQ